MPVLATLFLTKALFLALHLPLEDKVLALHFERRRDQGLQVEDKENFVECLGVALGKGTHWGNQAVEDMGLQLAFLLSAVDSGNREEAFRMVHLVVGGKVAGLNWELGDTESHLEVRMEDKVRLLRVVGRKVADHSQSDTAVLHCSWDTVDSTLSLIISCGNNFLY